MKKIIVRVHIDNEQISPEMKLKKQAEFFILLAEMKKERLQNEKN